MTAELDLAEWLSRLEQLHPSEIELGLDRVAEVARRMDLLHPSATVVTVAGTNGKGSTVAAIDHLLRSEGIKTAVYSSPHLIRFNERIRLNGEMATDDLIIEAFQEIEIARSEISLTYFEFTTLAGLLVFKHFQPEVMVLEVGLGGRLDAVNILPPDIAVITTISLDHQDWLGDTREEIALEKAGILREGTPLVCADLDPVSTLRERAEMLACPSFYVTEERAAQFSGLQLRPENLAAAAETVQRLGVDMSSGRTRELLAELQVTGRSQRLELDGVECWLDVAHNPDAVANLASNLTAEATSGRTIAVFAALSDKNIHAMIRSIAGQIDAWFVAELPGVKRSQEAGSIAAALRELGEQMISESANPVQAYRRALSVVGEGGRVVVFGSFHTVAAVMPSIEKDLKKLE